ncbi:hypothetical protein HNR23_000787 [Nocardiopsis mwathae]|uniref:Uncharacterized protein n=1 Tax=Nocardiopsis mwathae TaxID=1472723 RepID=A0A7W9YEQ5_9ACTN|nr:hypothetical protein [Nocardiopsis mwathae]MBB6170727.1 hypothetical protein [Nocardiopsis mwathae]
MDPVGPDQTVLHPASRNYTPYAVATTELARHVLHALFRNDSALIDSVIQDFLALDRDQGGYGWVVIDETDHAVVRHMVIQQGRALLARLESADADRD